MSVDGASLHGRRVIYTDQAQITSANVVDVLDKTIGTHRINAGEIQYLYNYYKGKQPINDRRKENTSASCNRVCENHANEIVSFKVSYLMGESVQYVNRSGNDDITKSINLLNEYVFAEDKAVKDKELAEWFEICGTAFRMIITDKKDEEDESPFEIFTLDPRFTYVVYHTGLGNKPVMAVVCTNVVDNETFTLANTSNMGEVFTVYTPTEVFEIKDGKIIKEEGNPLGDIPIVEYPLNNARLGAFEIVLPLLDAINEAASGRLDNLDDFIQAFLMFKGIDVESDEFRMLKEMRAFSVPEEGDVKYLVQELNQTQTQTMVDYMYQTVLTICGMPSMGNGKSDSSNNGAVILKNGWQGAEARAKDTEMMFKKSEKQFLRIALRIVDAMRGINLKLSDIEIRFTRRNYENITEKANVLMLLLSSNKVHPRLAFEHSGLFVDPEVAYMMSDEYYQEQRKILEQTLTENTEGDTDEDNPTDR